jgi:hypothetical protein
LRKYKEFGFRQIWNVCVRGYPVCWGVQERDSMQGGGEEERSACRVALRVQQSKAEEKGAVREMACGSGCKLKEKRFEHIARGCVVKPAAPIDHRCQRQAWQRHYCRLRPSRALSKAKPGWVQFKVKVLKHVKWTKNPHEKKGV